MMGPATPPSVVIDGSNVATTARCKQMGWDEGRVLHVMQVRRAYLSRMSSCGRKITILSTHSAL